jgi:tetratricopeptide (TPR) repeat protein
VRVRPRLATALASLVAAGLLLVVGLLLFRPDPRDELRAADRLFAAGRYHEALGAYSALAPALPAAQQRLGLVRALRGEGLVAERALRAAMQRGLADGDYQLALLYLGRALADSERAALADATWRLLEDCRSPRACAYRGPGRLMRADEALRRGDSAAATTGYMAALDQPLPPAWAALARYRLALLRAPDDQAAAVALLARPAPAPGAPADALLAPLLPAVGDEPAQLAAVLQAPAAERPQLLGQLYLGLGLFGLAEGQFARVDPRGPEALSAAAYAAYTRWRAGDVEGGLARLQALVASHPDEPRARTLLALALLTADAPDAARDQIDAVAQLTPGDPDLQLAWASWHAARREYDQASLAYERAISVAPPAERGRYALIAAEFHLAATFEQCAAGLPLAERAAAALGQHAGALTTLAAHRYACGQFAGAVEAATAAQAAGAGPDAAYYLGAALAALGQRDDARTALVRAADLAPASEWRRRAELALAALP